MRMRIESRPNRRLKIGEFTFQTLYISDFILSGKFSFFSNIEQKVKCFFFFTYFSVKIH